MPLTPYPYYHTLGKFSSLRYFLDLLKGRMGANARLGWGLVFDDEIAAQQRMHIRYNFGCASNAISEGEGGPRQPAIFVKAEA